MKIAVCISGQSRTWRTAIDNIKSYFNIGAEVDYFIHTWDTNTYRNSNEIVTQKKDYKIVGNEEEEIKTAFNPVLFESDEYTFENYGRNWQALFYSFMKSVWLKKQYEIKNDFVYDIVVKTRFDINFYQDGFAKPPIPFKKFYLHKINPLTAYTVNNTFGRFPTEFNYPSFDDVFFYSDSTTMDIISNLYRWNQKIIESADEKRKYGHFIDDIENFCGPGVLLYRYLKLWNIHPHCEIPIPYYVVRKEAEELGLNGLTDWQKIYKISRDYYNNITIAEENKNKLI